MAGGKVEGEEESGRARAGFVMFELVMMWSITHASCCCMQILENNVDTDSTAAQSPQTWLQSWVRLTWQLSQNPTTASRLLLSLLSNGDIYGLKCAPSSLRLADSPCLLYVFDYWRLFLYLKAAALV